METSHLGTVPPKAFWCFLLWELSAEGQVLLTLQNSGLCSSPSLVCFPAVGVKTAHSQSRQ